MKKLTLMVMGLALFFSACNNCQEPKEEVAAVVEEIGCQMTEEQKAFKADWENWANLAEDKKVELVAKAKADFDAKKAECEAKLAEMTEEEKAECAKKEAEMTEECKAKKAEMDAKKAELNAKMANWETMTIEEQKALMDEVRSSCCKHKCQKGEGEHKCQHAEGEGSHEGCPNKK